MGYCPHALAPTQIVLLGATGDLAQKKLIPALYDLFVRGMLPERLHVIGLARDEKSDEEYRAFVLACLAKKGRSRTKQTEAFAKSFAYVRGSFEDQAAFASVKAALLAYDSAIGQCTSKLFYLAVPPSFYDTIFEQIARTGLDLPCAPGSSAESGGWVRVLVEKPFGSDLDNAHRLEDKLSVLFKEEQIYRIDHYLAKDTLQNILSFRFSNVLFEDRFNHEYVEAVYLKVFEAFDVSTRGAFFDGVGALRDVGQNHMLQMLALVAMEHPRSLSAVDLRAARAAVLRALAPPERSVLATDVVKGQYAGYRNTPHVDPESTTETYFALKAHIENERWRGVPFYLEHGKAMHESASEITIRFRSARDCVCGEHEPHDHPNFVRFSISPEQKITVRFWVRAPGSAFALESNDLVFDRDTAAKQGGASIADAYEEVLQNAICGDQTLFVSSKEQQAAWTYITKILELWEGAQPLPYKKGSAGPNAALQQDIAKLFAPL